MGKKLLTMMLAIVMLFSVAISANADGEVKVKVDGKEIKTDVAPVIKSGSTLVPIRAIAEALGADVQWDGGTRTVTVSTVDNEISLTLDSTTATVNGAAKTLEVAATLIDGRSMLPLRFVGESLGATVNYDGATKTVTVDYFTKMTGTLKIGGSTTIQPICQAAADKLNAQNKGLSISVAGGGSGAGIKGAMDGTFNIGAASRELSSAEITSNPGIEDTMIGSDGIAIALNTQNKVTALTKKQVFDIFTGKITNWKDVGGEDAPIFVQTREAGSGTLGAFMELAIQPTDKNGAIVSTATPHTSNSLLRQAVAGNKNAIGFVSFGYIDSSISTPTVEGVSATVVNALSKKWPYVRPLNIVTKGKPSGLTAQYINYLLSPEGQELLVKENYISLKQKN